MDDLRLIRVELPAASFWATDELHALEQYLNSLGLQTGPLSLDMVDAIYTEEIR
jgi:hypothetical protein